LEVDNSCRETLVLDGVKISSSDHVSLDVIEEESGTYSLSEVNSNFSNYIPEENKSITITGLLGNQEVKVTFTKTAQLCE
jgi:type II secretory pathway component PulC